MPVTMSFRALASFSKSKASESTSWQGLTLVHFSAQPEPFLTQNTPQTPPETPLHSMTPLKHPLNNPCMHPYLTECA
jgi:hypothetical protein